MNGDLELDLDLELDSNWIDEFEKIDKNYEQFYMEDLNYINFHSIYVNKNSDIEKIKEEKIILKKPNYISKEEILEILKKNSINNKYTVLSIVKYNIDLEPADITHFMKKSKEKEK